jgi:Coenzyme PQQ synthesis protein D (PqqD)
MSDKFVKRGVNTASRMLGGEMMVMSVTDSALFSLNEVGSAIWQAADGCTPLRSIVEQVVVGDYEVDLEEAYSDALDFVENLARHGVLTVTDEPVGGNRG